MTVSGSSGKKLGPLPKHWSKTDSHMQRKPGLLKQMKKGASFSIPQHCLLSNSQNSAGHSIHRQSSDMICTPSGSKRRLKSKFHLYMHRRGQNKLFCLTTIGSSLRVVWFVQGGMRAQRKPIDILKLQIIQSQAIKVKEVVIVISTHPSLPDCPPFLTSCQELRGKQSLSSN